MRCNVLASSPIEVRSQPVELHAWSTPECCHRRLGTDEATATQRIQLADRNAVPGHQEGLALIEPPHNLAAAIAQLTLGDFSGHERTVAQMLQARPAAMFRVRCEQGIPSPFERGVEHATGER